MRLVEDALGVGQVVDGCDGAVFDTQVFVDHLDHRGEAVGGARGRRDNAMLRRVEQLLVNTHDDIKRSGLLHRRADHHALHTLIEIGLPQ